MQRTRMMKKRRCCREATAEKNCKIEETNLVVLVRKIHFKNFSQKVKEREIQPSINNTRTIHIRDILTNHS